LALTEKRAVRTRTPISRIGTCSDKKEKREDMDFQKLSRRFKVHDFRGSGFTLLELLAVIFIISLLFALAVPSFTGIGVNSVKSDARRIASILRYLNDNSLSTKEVFPMKFRLSDKLVIYQAPEGEKTEKIEELRGVELPSHGLLREGEAVVFFGPTGASEALSVYLGDGKDALTVKLNPLSGRVKIVQNE
jgi:prepilin-type N-terminal cleavage/methylation domain-containing protein